MEKSQPRDTTSTGPGKDSYNTHSSDKDNAHRKSKKRQDGVGQSDHVNAGDHLWQHKHSVSKGPING